MIKLTLPLIASFGLLISCSYKDSQRRVHDEKIEAQSTFIEGQNSPRSDLSSDEQVLYTYENRLSIEKKINDPSVDVYSYIVKPLLPVFFNDNYITSRDHDDLSAIQSVLHLFNKSIARMIQEEHALTHEKDLKKNILIQYLNAVKLDCSNGRQSCNSLSFFKQDPTYSYKIVMAATQILVSRWKESVVAGDLSQNDVKNQFTEIFSAFEFTLMLKSRLHDRAFDSFFVSFQMEAKKYIKSRNSPELQSHLDNVTALYQKLGGLMTLSGSLGDKNTEEYRQFLETLSPLNCSRKTSVSEQQCSEVLFQDAIDYLLTDSETSIKILNEMFIADRDSGNHLVFSKAENLSDPQKKIFQTNLIRLNDQEKAIFVIVNRIFTENWNSSLAGNLWRKLYSQSHKKADLIESLIKVTNLFLKISLIDQGNRTFEHLRESFNRRDLVIGDRFQYVLSESDLPSRQWADLNEKVMILENFLETQLTQLGIRNSSTIKLIERLKTLSHNLKTTMVYPAMMTYATLLRGNRFDKFYTFDQRDFSYDDNTPFSILLGKQSAWFSFATNSEAINYSDAVFSAYFLFKSGFVDVTSETYLADSPHKEVAQRGTEKLSNVEILKYMVGDLFLANIKDYQDYYRYLEENFSRKDYGDFRLACSRIKNDLPVRANPFLLDLDASVFSGFGFQGMRGVIESFYHKDASEFKYFTFIRGFLKKKIRLAELLRISYKAYLNDRLTSGLLNTNQYNQEIEAADLVFDEALSEIKNLVAKYAGTYQRGHRLFNECLYPFLEKEFAAQKYVRHNLNDYIKKVYLKMAELRGQLSQAQSQPGMPSIPSGELDVSIYLTSDQKVSTGLPELSAGQLIQYQSSTQNISGDAYRVTKLDTLLKIKEILEGMTADEQKNVGSAISVAMPPDIKKTELFEKPNSEDIVTVKWHDSFEDFRSEYFKKVFQYTNDKEFFIGWQGTTTNIDFIPNRLSIISESLLLGKNFKYVDGICLKNGGNKMACQLPTQEILAPQNLVEEMIHIHNLLNMNLDDVDEVNFLKDLGRSTRFPLETIRNLFFDDKQSAPLTLLEKLFDAITEEILPTLKWGGTAGENRIAVGLGYITQFYVAQRDSQAKFFEKNDYMTKEERSLFLKESIELLAPTVDLIHEIENLQCFLPPLIYSVDGDQVGANINLNPTTNATSCLTSIVSNNSTSLAATEKKNLREFFLEDERVNDFKRFIRENFYSFTDCEYVTKGGEQTSIADSNLVESFFELKESKTCK